MCMNSNFKTDKYNDYIYFSEIWSIQTWKVEKYYPQILLSRYNLKEINDELEALDVVGKRRGALERGGSIDYDKVINIIINDFKQGFIKGVTFDRYED